MKRLRLRHGLLLLTVLLFLARASAQFIDDFNSSSVQIDPEGLEGWMFRARGMELPRWTFVKEGMATHRFLWMQPRTSVASGGL